MALLVGEVVRMVQVTRAGRVARQGESLGLMDPQGRWAATGRMRRAGKSSTILPLAKALATAYPAAMAHWEHSGLAAEATGAREEAAIPT